MDTRTIEALKGVTKIELDHDGVARKLKAAEYRGERCHLNPFETEAVVDMLKELEALRQAVASFEPCDCGEGCCIDPANCSSPVSFREKCRVMRSINLLPNEGE